MLGYKKIGPSVTVVTNSPSPCFLDISPRTENLPSPIGPPETDDILMRSPGSMRRLQFPDLQPGSPMKQRISVVEDAVAIQCQTNDITVSAFNELTSSIGESDRNLRVIIAQLQCNFEDKLEALKKEYEHRFELQVAENRRLQKSFGDLKAESNSTSRKLSMAIIKLRSLQDEVGLGHDEEFDELAQSLANQLNAGGSYSSSHTPQYASAPQTPLRPQTPA